MQKLETDLIQVNCPLCGSDACLPFVVAMDRLHVTATAFQLVRCSCCSLVYQNPRVSTSSIGKYYAGDYYVSRPGRSYGSLKREMRKRHIVEEMGCLPGNLLDVGCANGDFLVEMKRSGWRVEGVELSDEATSFCRLHHGIKVSCGDLDSRPDDGTKFDLITMWGVLPHMPNPLQTVQKAAKLLTDHGKLIICCANIESYAFKFSRGAWGHLDQPRHYCVFAPKTLHRLLTDCGLIPGEIVYEGRLWKPEILFPPINTLLQFLNGCPSGFMRSVAVRSLNLINSLLAIPLDAAARRLRQGAMILINARPQ